MRYELLKVCPDDERINDMMKTHSESGFIVITAYGGGDSDPLVLHGQKLNNRKLKANIKAAKYFFIPVWGIFFEVDEYGTQFELEQAFIVFNHQRSNKQEAPEYIKLLGQKWCAGCGQASFIYREAGADGKAQLVSTSGSTIRSYDSLFPIAAANTYFGALNEGAVGRLQDKALSYSGSRMYVAQSPNSVYEAMMRAGEHYFGFFKRC